METKSVKNKMDRIRVKLGCTGLFVVDLVGRSGRLALLWNDYDSIFIQNFSKWHIHAEVHSYDGKWFLTGFYGHLEPMKRDKGWSLPKHLKNYFSKSLDMYRSL